MNSHFLCCTFLGLTFEDIAGAAPNILTAFYRAYRPVLLALQLLERTLLSTLSKVLKIGLVCYMFIALGHEMR